MKMKTLYLLLPWLVFARAIRQPVKRTEIIKKVKYAFAMAVDYQTNQLYFSYSDEGSIKGARINLDTKDYTDDISDEFSHAIDQKTREVYIGGSNGIHKYNPDSEVEEVVTYGINIWDLFYKDQLYFVPFDVKELYTVENKTNIKFKPLENVQVSRFIIDADDIMYYSNDTGLYGQDKETNEVLFHENLSKPVLATDMDGNAYVAAQHKIYHMHKYGLNLLLEAEKCMGFAFDNNNNLVYSDQEHIVRLVLH